MIYEFRYRAGVRGVITAHLEADDLVKAQAQATSWVNSQPGVVFIPNSVAPWLIQAPAATVAAPPVEDDNTGALDKPDQAQQKANLQKLASERMSGTGVGSAVKPETARVGA